MIDSWAPLMIGQEGVWLGTRGCGAVAWQRPNLRILSSGREWPHVVHLSRSLWSGHFDLLPVDWCLIWKVCVCFEATSPKPMPLSVCVFFFFKGARVWSAPFSLPPTPQAFSFSSSPALTQIPQGTLKALMLRILQFEETKNLNIYRI